MASSPLPVVPSALDMVEAILPIIKHARMGGWEINVGLEWANGERFTVSGELKPKPTPFPQQAPAPQERDGK